MADLVPPEPVGEFRDAAVGTPDERDVVEGDRPRGVDLRPQSRERHDVEVAAEGTRQPVGERLPLDGGQEADGAEVDPEHRHSGARIEAQRVEDRAVAAEHQAEVGGLREIVQRLYATGSLAVL